MHITNRVTLHALLLAPIFAAHPVAAHCADSIREVLCTREYANNMPAFFLGDSVLFRMRPLARARHVVATTGRGR